MPLVRLVSHPKRNKFLCDKIINIEGIPESLMFFKRDGKNFVKEPWTIDVTANIPEAVRAKFQPQPLKVSVLFPPSEKGGKPLEDDLEVYGFSLDCQNGQGEQMWERLEALIEASVPRGEPIPEPVLVEPSMDDEHRGRGWTISSSDIPTAFIKSKEAPVLVTESGREISYTCNAPGCSKSFSKEQGLRMHKMKAHKVPVEA